ncbi:MAG TPA: CarD family transcriptional regulator [Roseiarcus sp.]|nr:CarD family transcriptional regulator [Roseiarcus sp.]
MNRSNGKVVDAKLQTKRPEDVKAQTPSKAQASANDPGLKAQKAAVAAPYKAVEPVAGGFAEAPVKPLSPPVAKQKPVARDEAAAPSKNAKPTSHRQGFKLNEFVVYPAHGVGQIVAVEEQEVAGFKLELFVISFAKDKMTLRVPTSKVSGVGMRKISDPDTAKRSLDILSGRARIKRTMWSRRAQEYETKINSGDIAAIAEVVRDLYRSEAQPEQSYSERQLYEAALDRMVREIAAVHKSNEIDALKAIEAQLQKTHTRQKAEVSDREIEEAA